MTTPNPVLKKLGLSDTDRAVIFHADDFGNLQSCLDAYRDLVEIGLVSSASTMVPCSWFPATAEFCRSHAGDPNLDMGVHPTKDTPELREAVREQNWPCRVADYETFLDTAVRDVIEASGIHVLGYRALRALMPGQGGS